MTGRLRVALDVGTATTSIALGEHGAPGAPPVVVSRPTPARDLAVFLAKLLEAGRKEAPGSIADMTVTVPETWLDGSAHGARAYERLRRTLLDELGWPRVAWLRQADCLAAEAAAHAARAARPGPMLVCDLGARTMCAVRCEVTDRTAVQVVSIAVAGAGGVSFDAELAAAASFAGRFDAAFSAIRRHQARRAAVVLPRAWSHPRYREARVYRLGDIEISAGTLIDAFAGTAARLRTMIGEVTDGDRAATAAVTGRFGAFPLVNRLLADDPALAGPPLWLGPDAAVRGALRAASQAIMVRGPEPPTVTLPLHRIRNGLIETDGVPLDPAADFAARDGLPVLVEVPADAPAAAPLTMRVDDRDVSVPLPALPPGAYRVGLRPSHAGAGVLVLVPASGGEPAFCPIAPNVTNAPAESSWSRTDDEH
ncbi:MULTISPECIES: hypothetical protein [Actinomadura]|uniref:Hsp70 family protein n=1 Tax=Actinomadura yumaensis TaxID=111807 RepID=A0ABW2CEN3_9ACTN|nr:hypothetical protein [Actinomadura sp. J1-007]MWK34658.1 hypothetical protein [Actinomadura sp. J1-007]